MFDNYLNTWRLAVLILLSALVIQAIGWWWWAGLLFIVYIFAEDDNDKSLSEKFFQRFDKKEKWP